MRRSIRSSRISEPASNKRVLPQHVLTSDCAKRAMNRDCLTQRISKNNPLQRILNTQTHSPSSWQTSSQTEKQTKHRKSPTEKITEQLEREEQVIQSDVNNSQKINKRQSDLQNSHKINNQQQLQKTEMKNIMNKNQTRNHYLSQIMINMIKLILNHTLRIYMKYVL